jgi:hypothetical protein
MFKANLGICCLSNLTGSKICNKFVHQHFCLFFELNSVLYSRSRDLPDSVITSGCKLTSLFYPSFLIQHEISSNFE